MKFDKNALFYSVLGASAIVGVCALIGCASAGYHPGYDAGYAPAPVSYAPPVAVYHHAPAVQLHLGVPHYGYHAPIIQHRTIIRTYNRPVYSAPRFTTVTRTRTYSSYPSYRSSYRSSFGGGRSSFRSSRR